MAKASKTFETIRETVDGTLLKVPIKIETQNGVTLFTCVAPGFGINVSGPDYHAIRKLVQEKLRKASSVKWEKVLRIHLEIDSVGDKDNGRNLRIVSEVLEVGVRTDGTPCYRRSGTWSHTVRDGDPREDIILSDEETVIILPYGADATAFHASLVKHFTQAAQFAVKEMKKKAKAHKPKTRSGTLTNAPL